LTRLGQQQVAHDREAAMRAQRAELEADLRHVVALIETEAAKWAERRSAVQALEQKLDHGMDDDPEDARMAWYVAAYEDAQHAIVVTHGLLQRYNEIARALSSCQQELLQLPRDHRRG
jgi:uncharacterized protein YjiS (DUF1127 family)